MVEAQAFFTPVGELCRRTVVTCTPEESVVAVAGRMRQESISSVVVCAEGRPVGIVTDRDLRNKVVAGGLDPTTLTVRTVMNTPLITAATGEFLFEALHRMTERGTHRLVVLDAAGALYGIVTDSDILQWQSRSPQQLLRAISTASGIDELTALHRQVQGLTAHLLGHGARIADLVRLVAHLNDRLLLRLIALLRQERFADLTSGFSFVVLGSEGRGEQTLTTDQDNAILLDDGLDDVLRARIHDFAEALIADLLAIGVPPCPGGIMARNPAWQRPLGEWQQTLDGWMAVPLPENILQASMVFDLRTLYGDPKLELRLREHIAARMAGNTGFLLQMASNVMRFAVPLGWFGRIRTERQGEHRGELELKKAGIFAITEGIKVLALESGDFSGGTRERLLRLKTAGVFAESEADDLLAAYDTLVYLRLRGQMEALDAGREPTNHIELAHLNRMEQGRLRLALEGVRNFQEFLRLRFHLD